jgi:hypothetical protein
VIGFIGAAAGFDAETLKPIAGVAGAVLGVLVGIAVTRMVLRTSWSDFRIILAPRNPWGAPMLRS